ncbi:MAG: 50S ribosomal protein L13 [Patescibacteria group bacterium]
MTTYEIDATNQSMGRLASRVAILLRGKDLPTYQPHVLPLTQVVLKNIDKIKFTGSKFTGKLYHRYSGYPGGIHTKSLAELWAKNPKEVVRKAIYRMLPVNRMRDRIIRHLKFQ